MKAYLPAVIRLAERQRPQVERLLQYCYDLDGTKIDVIEGPGPGDNLPYPQRNDAAFHEAAAKYAGRAFLWVEPDSVPRYAGWLRDISDEYRRVGMPFLLPDMSSAQKQDIAAGIGVYPPETSWLVPKKFETSAWDLWLTSHPINKIVGRTRMIQHSYGAYIGKKAQDHRFPRDNDLLWPETRLFHRDLHQDIITLAGYPPISKVPVVPLPEPSTLRHGGDLGDIIAALPILRAKGGGRIILFHDPNAPVGQRGRESLEGARYGAIKPLLEAQSYVTSVEWGTGIDTANFRTTPRPMNESLLERQARHVGMWPLTIFPWLTVPEMSHHDRVIVGRSARYHNPHGFPWREVARAYGDKLLFLGLPSEHEAFEKAAGRPVEHRPTANLLEAAGLIAGANLCYFNQSCLAWVAIGLGVRMVLEANPEVPNTSVQTHPRSFFATFPDDLTQVRNALKKL